MIFFFFLPHILIAYHLFEKKKQSEDDESLLSDWCFPTTISVLTVDRILLLLSAAMLERTIVIVCENRGVLSSIMYVQPKK